MRELLLVFIFALVAGSIINGLPKESPHTAPGSRINSGPGTNPGSATNVTAGTQSTAPHRDFPDFNSFPALNLDNFNSLVIESDKPVFVVCYSPNNLSYERMVPLIAALAQEHGDSLKVARLNIMENPLLSQRYEVFSVPTYLVFNKGQVTTKWAGIVAKDRLEAMIATTKP